MSEFDTITLEAVKFHSQTIINTAKGIGDRAKLGSYLDMVTGNLVLSLQTTIWSQKMGSVEIAYPVTWWDHVKLDLGRHLPRWLRKRMQIRRRHQVVRVYQGYPEVKAPPGVQSVRFLLKGQETFGVADVDTEVPERRES